MLYAYNHPCMRLPAGIAKRGERLNTTNSPAHAAAFANNKQWAMDEQLWLLRLYREYTTCTYWTQIDTILIRILKPPVNANVWCSDSYARWCLNSRNQLKTNGLQFCSRPDEKR